MQTRLLQIREGVLSKNDALAASLRQRFQAAGVFAVNFVSSPGAGKTLLLEKTIHLLTERSYRVATLVGDLATDNDARRLAATGAPVRQIGTGGNCHLEAQMIAQHLEGWSLDALDFLFIENVGNLVCPASYDLGETLRVVLLCTTEGEDKPLKYPPMFNSSDIALITKIDLAEAVEFDRAAAQANLRSVRPGMTIVEVSAKRGTGMEAWIDFLICGAQTWRRQFTGETALATDH
jgi:hydrogenase nickel incorporation protein HypB